MAKTEKGHGNGVIDLHDRNCVAERVKGVLNPNFDGGGAIRPLPRDGGVEELALPRLIRLNCLDFAATVTALYCPLTYTG